MEIQHSTESNDLPWKIKDVGDHDELFLLEPPRHILYMLASEIRCAKTRQHRAVTMHSTCSRLVIVSRALDPSLLWVADASQLPAAATTTFNRSQRSTPG